MYPGRYIGASGGGLDALCWTGDVRRLKLKQRTDFAFAFTVSRQASPVKRLPPQVPATARL